MIGTFAGGDALCPGEGRIVRELDVESRREAEAGRIGKVDGPGREQAGFRRSARGTQVDLDPGGGVGLGINRRVVAVRPAVSGREWFSGVSRSSSLESP